VGTTRKPRTLDPADAYELRSLVLIKNLCDRLYSYEPGSTELKPQLATALPKISGDGLTYTIPVRSGVLFHDGTPFNAEAMAFSLNRFMQNKGKPHLLLAERVESIKATNPQELIIKLKKPFAAFSATLAYTGACALSPKAYEIGEKKFAPNTFVGTGPYKLVKDDSDKLELAPFENYWGKKPENKGVVVQIFLNNPANLYNALTTGAIDVAYLSLDADQVRDLQKREKTEPWQTIGFDGISASYMVLNARQKPLDNVLVRQAIAAMVDRNLINDRVLYGQGQPLYSIIPSTFDVSQPVFKGVYGDGNVTKAQELLKQAGYTPENPLRLKIWYSSSSLPLRLAAALLVDYADQKMGGLLKLETDTVEGPTFYANVGKGVYQISLSDWYPDFLDADNYIQPFLSCPKGSVENGCEEGGSQNQGLFYYNDTMNKLISDQAAAKDPLVRNKILADIQGLLVKDVPLIPLWQSRNYVFARKNISGVAIDPLQNLPYETIKRIE
jgi:peptide/nickel transport system substrate-binding protein